MKEKAYTDVQEYIASKKWAKVKKELDKRMEELTELITGDLLGVQPLVHSCNILRGKANDVTQEFIDKIANDHLKGVLKTCIIGDNIEKSLMPTEESEDVIKFSEKDWFRRERRILRYIADFEKVYGQEVVIDDNEVEGGQNSLESGISI